MKAILARAFGGPEVLTLEDVPDPVAGAGQVRVRIHAVGVNPYDTYMRAGGYAIKPELPYIPGADAAGDIPFVLKKEFIAADRNGDGDVSRREWLGSRSRPRGRHRQLRHQCSRRAHREAARRLARHAGEGVPVARPTHGGDPGSRRRGLPRRTPAPSA